MIVLTKQRSVLCMSWRAKHVNGEITSLRFCFCLYDIARVVGLLQNAAQENYLRLLSRCHPANVWNVPYISATLEL